MARHKANEEQRKIIGDRLKELLEKDGHTQAWLIHKMEQLDKPKVNSSHLSNIINGSRSLPNDFARQFAAILDKDPGYLLGLDDFRASSYDEYLKIMGRKAEIDADITAMTKYDYLINPLGYRVIGMSKFGDSNTDYAIYRRGKAATIPAYRMDQFIDDVNRYIKNGLDHLMQTYASDDLADSHLKTEKVLREIVTDKEA